jgi:CO/xanthine dehydrogenase Mo-binding subunit
MRLVHRAGRRPAGTPLMPASPLPVSPNGLLEVGYSRITASTAVVNAVADALGTGDRPIHLPLTPARVRALVLGAEGR